MRLSSFTILVVVPFSFAAPIFNNRGFLDDVKGAAKTVGNIINSNATLAGVAGTVKQSIENPKLTASRIQVVKSLSDTQSSLDGISAQANATSNAGLTSLVADAQQGVTAAHDGINRIGDALLSGKKGSTDDQKAVAVGIKDARTAVNSMSAAVTTPDATLSSQIDGAVKNVANLQAGGQGVLDASGLTFADLGLPDDFATS